jgi:YfiH family protein
MDLVWLKVPQWEDREGFVHGFLGRRGGKSLGDYASLNVSFRVGDNPELVKDNLCDMKKAVGLHDLRIVTMRQVHGNHILDIRDKHLKEASEADGMVSGEREIFLGVLTADCVPILFNVPDKKLVAGLHAGWRGTLAGITTKMVNHLRERFDVEPASVEVAMGPAIGPCCYEIGTDVSNSIVQKWGGTAKKTLQLRDGKSYLDLRQLNRLQLEEAGVPSEKTYQIGPCTSCAANDFFSYRRQKKKNGLQISFIGWL